MKNTYMVILAVLLVVALAVPAFASGNVPGYDNLGLLDIPFDTTEYPYIIVFELGNLTHVMGCREATINGKTVYSTNGYIDVSCFSSSPTDWVNRYTSEGSSTHDLSGAQILLNYIPGKTCDGSACPATDANHDNVCDDCGKVLAFSLRSDLLSYAYSHMQDGLDAFPNAEYWIITDNTEGGYTIHLATSPFTYGMSTGILSSDGAIYSSSVIQMASGQNGGRGWKNHSAGTPLEYGNPVESSHEIDGFFPDPLWKEMEKVTQGAIVAEQIRINRTMGILTALGVGCLALLLLLTLLRKQLGVFQIR